MVLVNDFFDNSDYGLVVHASLAYFSQRITGGDGKRYDHKISLFRPKLTVQETIRRIVSMPKLWVDDFHRDFSVLLEIVVLLHDLSVFHTHPDMPFDNFLILSAIVLRQIAHCHHWFHSNLSRNIWNDFHIFVSRAIAELVFLITCSSTDILWDGTQLESHRFASTCQLFTPGSAPSVTLFGHLFSASQSQWFADCLAWKRRKAFWIRRLSEESKRETSDWFLRHRTCDSHDESHKIKNLN